MDMFNQTQGITQTKDMSDSESNLVPSFAALVHHLSLLINVIVKEISVCLVTILLIQKDKMR